MAKKDKEAKKKQDQGKKDKRTESQLQRPVAQFDLSLQQAVQDGLAPGATKTAMVYRLKGNEPQSHE